MRGWKQEIRCTIATAAWAARSGWWSVLFVLVLSTGAPHAQVSPGDLSAPHAGLDAVRDCKKCHERGDGGMDARCMHCHGAIRKLVRSGGGFHGRRGVEDCAGCHPDHAGREFDLIQWEDGGSEKFRHQRAGWTLTGKHETTDCRKCHKPEFQQADLLEGEPGEDHSNSWLGLSRECRTCHLDPHAGELGEDCGKCHGTGRFKPAVRLDHDATRFPLTGKHVDVKCEKCHLVPGKVFSTAADGKIYPRFKNLPFGECSDCHKDVHAGGLGPRCADCHVTAGFKIVDPARFDHRKTRWPLRGSHSKVKCAGCHDPVRGWGKKPPFKACGDCHKDAHNGTATLAGRKVDCASCHNENRFTPSTYTVEQHKDSEYPLKGKHARVDCGKCHTKIAGTKQVQLRPSRDRCLDCHKDLHGGQFNSRTDGGACESCHTVEGWKPATYGPEEHATRKVTLAGRHGQVECSACHSMLRPGLRPLPAGYRAGKANVALVGIETECRDCHLDVHEGRFEPGGAQPVEGGCARCHGAEKFSPSLVDVPLHERFAYALKGGHRAVPCFVCHKVLLERPSRIKLLKAEGAVRRLEFKEPHERCTDCHQTPHGDQFEHRADKGAREGCHRVDSFRPAPMFDHEKDARFALAGAHKTVGCLKCHNQKIEKDGKLLTVWRPLQKECEDCHRKKMILSKEIER